MGDYVHEPQQPAGGDYGDRDGRSRYEGSEPEQQPARSLQAATAPAHGICSTAPAAIWFGFAIPFATQIESTVTPYRPAIAPSVSPALIV